MTNNQKAMKIALRTVLSRAQAAGGDKAVEAVKDRLMANYSLISNSSQSKEKSH